MQPVKNEEQAGQVASKGEQKRGTEQATPRDALENSLEAGGTAESVLCGSLDPRNSRPGTTEGNITEVKVETAKLPQAAVETGADTTAVNPRARRRPGELASSTQEGSKLTKESSPPRWFFGNCETSNYLLRTIKEDMALIDLDAAYNKSKYKELQRQERVCMTDNCWFGDQNRSCGEVMVVLPISPEAHQSKGVRGKQFYLRKKERLFRDKVRKAVVQKLKFWDFENWGVLIPPGSILEIKQLEFSYPYCKYHGRTPSGTSGLSLAKDTAPDLDNLMKAFFDALEGLLFVNDCAICTYNGVSKVHCTEFKITCWLKWSKSKRPCRLRAGSCKPIDQ